MTTHTIKPNPGEIFIFRIHDEKYTKSEIINLYNGVPANRGMVNPLIMVTILFDTYIKPMKIPKNLNTRLKKN